MQKKITKHKITTKFLTNEQAVEQSKFSMERKAGLASDSSGCLGGSLSTGFGSANPTSSSMIIGLSTDPCSQGKRKSLIG